MAHRSTRIAALELLACLLCVPFAKAEPHIRYQQTPSPTAAPDEIAVESLVREGTQSYRGGLFQQTISKAREALRISPRHPKALALLAIGYYGCEKWEYFGRAAIEAIRAGGVVPIELAHHHTLSGIHRAALGLTANEIGYHPLGAAKECSEPQMTAPLASVTSLSLRSTTQGELFLNLRLRDKDDPEKVHNFNFADPRSVTDRSGPLPVIRPPGRAPLLLGAVKSVIEAAKEGRSLGPLPAETEPSPSATSTAEPSAAIAPALIGTWVRLDINSEKAFSGDGSYRSVTSGSGPVLSGVAEQVGKFRVQGNLLILDPLVENWTPLPGTTGNPPYRGRPVSPKRFQFFLQGSTLVLRDLEFNDTIRLTRKR